MSGRSRELPDDSARRRADPGPFRLYLLGESALNRAAYRALFRDVCGLETIAESDFSPTAVWAALRERPSLAIADVDGAPPGGVDSVAMVRTLVPEAYILLLSSRFDAQHVQTWAESRPSAIVVKAGGVAELCAAMSSLARGHEYFSKGAREAIDAATLALAPRGVLSRREAELLPLLARGLPLREAARRMTVSYKTADSYRTSLLRKLGLRDRVELARYAIREGIVEA